MGIDLSNKLKELIIENSHPGYGVVDGRVIPDKNINELVEEIMELFEEGD